MSKIGIDLQHNGRKSVTGSSRLGFVDPLGEGKDEYSWIAQYGIGMQIRLHQLGHHTFLNGMGEYPDRAKRFNTHNCNLVVLCHVNQNPPSIRFGSKGNRTGKIFLHHQTSKLNVERAKKAAEYLSRHVPWGFEVVMAKPTDWTRNALNVQKGYKAWTWVLEPFFGDQRVQRKWVSTYTTRFQPGGVMKFGALIADAIDFAYG